MGCSQPIRKRKSIRDIQGQDYMDRLETMPSDRLNSQMPYNFVATQQTFLKGQLRATEGFPSATVFSQGKMDFQSLQTPDCTNFLNSPRFGNQYTATTVTSNFKQKGGISNKCQLSTKTSMSMIESKPVIAPAIKSYKTSTSSQTHNSLLAFVPQLEQFIQKYDEYLSQHHASLYKLVRSMDILYIRSSLKVLFDTISTLNQVEEDWKLFQILAEATELEVRAKLSAFSKSLWSNQPGNKQTTLSENVLDSVVQLSRESSMCEKSEIYWRRVLTYLNQRFH